MYSKIISSASFIPEDTLSNFDLEKMIETSDEWIVQHTGISTRSINKNKDNFEMASIAAKRAIEKINLDPNEIDMVIATTVTPDFFTPSLACVIQGEIGANNAFAFDMNAGCSGFVYALDTADSFIKMGKAKTVLICCSEILSRIVDYKDRSSCILFGDASSAVILKADENAGIMGRFLGADGTGAKFLGVRALYNNEAIQGEKSDHDLSQFIDSKYLKMDGHEVYKFAVKALPKALDKALEDSGLDITDLKYIIPHQANTRILDSVKKRYKLADGIIMMNINKYGNTSSASIPLLFDELVSEGKINKGDKIAFVGFGAGLTYGAVIAEM